MTTTMVEVEDLQLAKWVEGGRVVDGRMPLGGVDCWGLVVEVRRRAGLWTPDPWGCGPKPVERHPSGLPESFMRHLVTIDAPLPYCAVKLRSPWAGGHAGVYLPDGTVLHSQKNLNVVRVPFTRVRRITLALFDFDGAGLP